ncbi:MAG: AN1-type zinc finger domain-containing protein [Candidatus Helarchaeota archaeon]
MTNCQKCGKEVYMPFKCKYCGGLFCSKHRLPENHNCPKIGEAITLENEPNVVDIYQEPEYTASAPISSVQETVPWEPPEDNPNISGPFYDENGNIYYEERIPIYKINRPDKPVLKYFSKKELYHLSIGILLMFGVSFSMFYSYMLWFPNLFNFSLAQIIVLCGIVVPGFLFHELGHKFVGIHINCWSEFRLIKRTAILTAITIIPIPFIKFVLPGAVMISEIDPDKDREKMGKIAIAGPIVNFVIGIILLFFGINFVMNLNYTTKLWGFTILMGTALNINLGVFNLIPVLVLDGLKIYKWNKIYYFISLSIGIILLIITFWFLSIV